LTLKLHKEICDHKKSEKILREREKELNLKSRNFQELNTALKAMLKAREEDRADLEERVLSNVKELVIPFVDRLLKSRLDSEQRASGWRIG
jgi:hypothetical protein